jgi:thiamine kinase-like enzyme
MDGQKQQEIESVKLARIKGLPLWHGTLNVRPLKGGISNESWLVTDEAKTLVVRFGEDYPFHHVNRAHEAMVARAAHAAGFAPELVHFEQGMMVSQFLNAQTFDAALVRDNLKDIAKLVRDFHQTMPNHVTGAANLFWVFHVIRDYARTLTARSSRHVPVLTALLSEARALEAVQVPLPVIFGHNDLLPANFLKSDDRLWLIDFEYAGFSTAMFDLAGLSSNAGFDDQQSEELLALYFGVKPDVKLAQSLAAMQCASLLREALWSMVSELYLTAPGVDYAAYTQDQLSSYRAKLEQYQTKYGRI